MSNDYLYNLCCWNDTEEVKSLLSDFSDLDVLYKKGILFSFSIANKNSKLTKHLLDYFENKQYTVKSKNYVSAKQELVRILEDAIGGTKLSLEMNKILSPYINSGASKASLNFDKVSLVRSVEDQVNVEDNKDTLTVAPDDFRIRDKRLIKHHDNTSTDVSIDSNNQFTYEYKSLITNTQDDIEVHYSHLNNNTTSEKNLHDFINTADTFGIGEQQQSDGENEMQVLGDDG